jgi:glutamine synthetase type III
VPLGLSSRLVFFAIQVAPNQYEFAPMFGLATTQIDQNLMVMQVAEEVSARHGLACLMMEKPFKGINGSGTHAAQAHAQALLGFPPFSCGFFFFFVS